MPPAIYVVPFIIDLSPKQSCSVESSASELLYVEKFTGRKQELMASSLNLIGHEVAALVVNP